MLGPIPGIILLTVIALGALFYYLSKPQCHPGLGEKILKGDGRFARYEQEGYPVYTARYPVGVDENMDGLISRDEEDRPSTRNLYLYFRAKGYAPTNEERDEYDYIALPPTRNDWLVEFLLWLFIPLVVAIYGIGARIAKIASIVLFFYLFLVLIFGLVYMPARYLFGDTMGLIFAIAAGGAISLLAVTRYRNTRLLQWVTLL